MSLSIVQLLSENVLNLNLEDFKKIIEADDLADRSLAIISIAGAMRKGKSFLMNFLLKYAYQNYSTTKTIKPLKSYQGDSLFDGFSHNGGSVRHTTGIQIWPDIFLHEYLDGKKIAILFMDTQGTFDYETKFSDCVSIFALGTLLSSVQIYNIHHNIQNDNLQYLSLYTEYARTALSQISLGSEDPPFDTLQLLVRDWNFPYENQYGLEGGRNVLRQAFGGRTDEIKKTVASIKDTFKTIECFLMPHPGNVVAHAKKVECDESMIDKEFMDHVNQLVDHLLSPKNIKIKKFNGDELKGKQFIHLLRRGFDILNKFENIPKPTTVLSSIAESQNYKLIDDAVEIYGKSMDAFVSKDDYLEQFSLNDFHNKSKNKSVQFYDNSAKLETCDSESAEQWKKLLNDRITQRFNYFIVLNERNHPQKSEAIEKLIMVATESVEIDKHLNEKHTKNMLDLLNAFRANEEKHKMEIEQLTASFEKSPKEGFDFLGILMKIVPTAVEFVKTWIDNKKNPVKN